MDFEKKISEIKTIIEKGSGVASKDDLDAVKNKIPNVSGFLLTSVFNSKIYEVENKIPDIKKLVNKTELTAVEKKSNVSIFIVYKLNLHTINDDFALKDGLFGAVEIREKYKNNPNNYVYSGFGICFDSKSTFTHSDGSTAHNVIIFGTDGNLSSRVGNKATKNLMVIGKGLMQKNNNKQTVYPDCPLINNFTQTNKKFVLSIHYYQPFGKLFVNGKKQSDFPCLKSEIKPYKMCLGNISKYFSSTNALKTGLHGNVYDFSVGYKIL